MSDEPSNIINFFEAAAKLNQQQAWADIDNGIIAILSVPGFGLVTDCFEQDEATWNMLFKGLKSVIETDDLSGKENEVKWIKVCTGIAACQARPPYNDHDNKKLFGEKAKSLIEFYGGRTQDDMAVQKMRDYVYALHQIYIADRGDNHIKYVPGLFEDSDYER